MIFQLFILLTLAIIGYRSFRMFRKKILGFFGILLIFIIIFTTGFFLIYPEKSNTIASLIGVGRGVDAAFLLIILFLLFITFKLYMRTERLDRDITALATEISKKFHKK